MNGNEIIFNSKNEALSALSEATNARIIIAKGLTKEIFDKIKNWLGESWNGFRSVDFMDLESSSAAISSIRYNQKSKILEVAFNDRGTYQYFNVSKTTMKQFLNAESKGAFLNRKIKDRYNYKKVAKITKKKKSRSMFIGRMLAKTELSKKYMENFK